MDTPRTYDEVRRDAMRAIDARDTQLAHTYAAELRTFPQPEAAAYAGYYEGVAWLYGGDPQNATARFTEARALAHELQLQHLAAIIETADGQAYMTFGRYPEALERLDASVAAFASLPIDRASMIARRARSTVLRMTGAFADAFEESMTALDLARIHADTYMEAQCLYDVGTLYMMTGDLPQAFATLYTALDLYEQHGTPYDVASTLGQLASTYAQFQDVDRAREMFLRAIDIYTSHSEPMGLIDNYGNLGITHLNAGAFEEAHTYLTRAIETAEKVGADHHRTFFIEALATALHGLGRFDEALTLLDAELENFRNYPEIAISASVTRSKILAANGNVAGANALLLESLAALESDPRTDLKIYVRDALRSVARAGGDFDAYLEHDAAYNAMNEELRGKATTQKVMLQEKERELSVIHQNHQRHLDVLYSTLPPAIANRVANGETVNDVHPNVAVLFMDIVGYTTHSGRMEPSEVTELLGQIFAAFDSICNAHNVTKIKTIGDSYMAVAFPVEEHAESSEEHRIARAACEMIAAKFTWSTGEPVQFRIGIHSGPVVAGVIGTQRLQYDVWGDTVNVASRMESSGEPGKIHVSDVFAQCLGAAREDVVLTPRGEVEIKGKGPMNTFWLEGA